MVRRAIADGYVLVTNNTADFRARLGREEVHAGLVCINVAPGLMAWMCGKRLFALALDRLGDREPVDELLPAVTVACDDGKSEADLIWLAMIALRGALAEADVKPR